MPIQIVENTEPTEADWLAILRPLHAYNGEKAGGGPAQRLALLLKDAAIGESVGGLYGQTYWGWLTVDLLFVPEAARGKGVGSTLLARAEQMAASRGCRNVWLDTFSFQAPEFYRKRGYEVFGALDDYPEGVSRIFFRKRLVPAP